MGLLDDAKKLDDLPPEMLKEIMRFLSDRDLKRAQKTTKKLAVWAKDERDARARKKREKFNKSVDAFLAKAAVRQRAFERAQQDADGAWDD